MKKFNELLSNIKDIEESIKLDEVLKASDPTSKWISDFVHSDNPKFKGKSKKQRIQMALGAAYAAKRASKNEELDLSVIESIAEELDLEIIEQKSDLEYAEDARIEALKLKEDDNLDGFHMLMAIHHCHLSEHFAENQKHNLAEKHDLLAVEHLNELDESYSSELLEKLLTDGVASATADYGVPVKMLPAGPAKNKTWAHQKGRAARGTTYDAAVDKEVRTSKTKTPATINPKRRKEVEQEINRKAIFGEEIEQIDELSQEKLTSYMRAAKKDINKNLRAGEPTPGSKRAAKVEKRVAGYRKAWAKVEKQNEEVEQYVDEAINPENPRDYNKPTYLRKKAGQAPLTTKDIKDRDTESSTTPEGLAKKAKRLGLGEEGVAEGMMPSVSASIGGSMGSSGRAYAKTKLLAAKAKGTTK